MSVLVLTKALDEGYLLRSGVNFTLAGLTISRAPPLDGYQGIMIQNPARQGLGYLVWQAEQPGDSEGQRQARIELPFLDGVNRLSGDLQLIRELRLRWERDASLGWAVKRNGATGAIGMGRGQDGLGPLRCGGDPLGNRDPGRPSRPRSLLDHRSRSALGAGVSQVNIKATTTEQMGFAGRGEGIAVMASVLLIAN